MSYQGIEPKDIPEGHCWVKGKHLTRLCTTLAIPFTKVIGRWRHFYKWVQKGQKRAKAKTQPVFNGVAIPNNRRKELREAIIKKRQKGHKERLSRYQKHQEAFRKLQKVVGTRTLKVKFSHRWDKENNKPAWLPDHDYKQKYPAVWPLFFAVFKIQISTRTKGRLEYYLKGGVQVEVTLWKYRRRFKGMNDEFGVPPKYQKYHGCQMCGRRGRVRSDWNNAILCWHCCP